MTRTERLAVVVILTFMGFVAAVAIYFRNTANDAAAAATQSALDNHIAGGPHAGVVDSLGDHEIRIRELERIVSELREKIAK